jgi:hypothetical protein
MTVGHHHVPISPDISHHDLSINVEHVDCNSLRMASRVARMSALLEELTRATRHIKLLWYRPPSQLVCNEISTGVDWPLSYAWIPCRTCSSCGDQVNSMGVLMRESFHTSRSCCTQFCLGEVVNGAKRGALLRSSCGSDGGPTMFLSMQSYRCTGPAHQMS